MPSPTRPPEPQSDPDYVICPHCRFRHECPWEFSLGVGDCPECDRTFVLSTRTITLYETVPAERPADTAEPCGHCKSRPAIPGDEDGRCDGCKADGWVRTYKAGGWRQLGVYDG